MKSKGKNKKGISLIVLVIAIILMIILAATVIISLNGGNIFGRAKEAVFKNDIKNYQEELNMVVANEKLMQNDEREKITAMQYEQDGNPNSVYTYIPDFKKKYEGKIVIKEDMIVYVGLDDTEREWTLKSGAYRSKKNTIQYLDENGNKLADDEYISQLDVEYVYNAKEIEGYMPLIDELSGVSNSDTEVIFEYCKICDNLAFVGVDENGSETEDTSAIVEYKVSGKGSCTNKYVAIPEVYNGKPVTGIKSDAFKNNTTIIKMVIPNSINKLESNTFRGARLQFVKLNIKRIDRYSFYGLGTLKGLVIGKDVGYLDGDVFAGNGITDLYIFFEATLNGLNPFGSMPNCKKINTNKDNNKYTEIDGVLYSKDKKTIVAYPSGIKDEEYIIPDYVEKIGDQAFRQTVYLKKIDIPNTVKQVIGGAFQSSGVKELYVDATNVNGRAFQNSNLEKVTIGPNVNSIGDVAFCDCTKIADVTILSEKSISYGNVFHGCTSLEEFKIGDTNSKYSVLGGVLIYNNTTLNAYPQGKKDEEYTVPNIIKSISDQAFRSNKNIKQINMHNSVTWIGWSAFTQATKLENITYYDTMESWNKISKNSFNSGASIKTITCTDGTINL